MYAILFYAAIRNFVDMDFKITFANSLKFETFNEAVYLGALKIVFFVDFCFFIFICRKYM